MEWALLYHLPSKKPHFIGDVVQTIKWGASVAVAVHAAWRDEINSFAC